jgi:hypothetical protein
LLGSGRLPCPKIALPVRVAGLRLGHDRTEVLRNHPAAAALTESLAAPSSAHREANGRVLDLEDDFKLASSVLVKLKDGLPRISTGNHKELKKFCQKTQFIETP